MSIITEQSATVPGGNGRRIGDRMEDGTLCAGISPDTTRPFYVLPADAPLIMQWKQAMEYAAGFEGGGQPKGAFRVPTQEELNVLFEHRARIGGFYENGRYAETWYWSSTVDGDFPNLAWDQSFDHGLRSMHHQNCEGRLRLVKD